jgi:hypothetical protein
VAKTRQRWLILVALVLTVALALPAAIGLYGWNLQQKINSWEWQESATPAERKAVAERLIRFPLCSPHDAFLILVREGDAASIPSLLSGLSHQPHTLPDGLMVCTKAHCLEALRRITGHNAGPNYADWQRWWDEVGSKLPATAFPLQESAAPGPWRPRVATLHAILMQGNRATALQY